MDYRQKISENEEEQIEFLRDLVSIQSKAADPVRTKDGELFPFGKGVQDAFAYMLQKAEALGFQTEDVEHYGGHIDFGSGERIVGVLGHLDVVPEGEGWSHDPYGGVISDGYLYGRGTLDDKGPMAAVLFAMKALKDAGYTPAKKIRLILGLDEETGWQGMKKYFEMMPLPDYGFTPDAEFPALNGEKGLMTFELAKKLPKLQSAGLELRSLTGGSAANMVAEKARAVISSQGGYDAIRQLASEYRQETGYKLSVKGVGKSLELSTEGKAAHGATPEAGLNAISILMDFLGRLNFGNDEVNGFIDFYNRHIGFDLYGERLGCAFEDAPSGKLTLNVGIIAYDRQSVSLTVNIRYPVTFTDEQVYNGIMPLINKYDMGVIKEEVKAPIYMEPDSPLIETLMEVYRENTGDTETKPLVIGGATYARAAENIVAFGALFPGDADLMHQKDERISIDRLMQMTRIYADALYKLTQPDFMPEKTIAAEN